MQPSHLAVLMARQALMLQWKATKPHNAFRQICNAKVKTFLPVPL